MLISDYVSYDTIICIWFLNLIHFVELGQKYKSIFVCFLFQMKTSKFASEIYWPLPIHPQESEMTSSAVLFQ